MKQEEKMEKTQGKVMKKSQEKEKEEHQSLARKKMKMADLVRERGEVKKVEPKGEKNSCLGMRSHHPQKEDLLLVEGKATTKEREEQWGKNQKKPMNESEVKIREKTKWYLLPLDTETPPPAMEKGATARER